MLLFGNDLNIIKESIDRTIKSFDTDMNFVEIGIYDGDTSRTLISYIESRIHNYNYYGIDPGVDDPGIKNENYLFLKKHSHLVSRFLPPFHWVFVDGCHCFQCVIRDIIYYGRKLVKDGYLLLHDSSNMSQGIDQQDYVFMKGYHNMDEAKKGIAVRNAIESCLKGNSNYRCIVDGSIIKSKGGVDVWQRLNSS